MTEQFVPFELAVKLKELGFDELCLSRWDGGGFKMLPAYDPLRNSEIKEVWFCALPLWQQAFDWFREKHNLTSWIYQSNDSKYHSAILIEARYLNGNLMFKTYEEARLACLQELIKIVESWNTQKK